MRLPSSLGKVDETTVVSNEESQNVESSKKAEEPVHV
jgi:hypothetical protein